MNDLRIIFMGTPDFAVPSLEILIENNFNVVAVITAPDKPKGRGQKVESSPVKSCAVRHNLTILQPTNLKDPKFIEELRGYHANLQIVVAFRMLPEVIWSMPAFGTFNLHASLLPQYRGAAPINWAIINGEKKTGVTTFFLKHEIDTGSIIFQEEENILDSDTVGTLYERLMQRGGKLVLKTVEAIQSGEFPTTPQTESTDIKHAPKIFKETCFIHWNQSSHKTVDFVRGLNPYPAAWTTLKGMNFKIYHVSVVPGKQEDQPIGSLSTDNKTYLHIKTNPGWIAVNELQPEGKKRMKIEDFLRGNNI